MVRPLTNEENLQNLDKLESTQLRTCFVEEVSRLRKQILGCMKSKQLAGIDIDGEAFVALVRNYVEAINSGAVPNIESTWHYISKEKGEKLFRTLSQSLESKTRMMKTLLPLPKKRLEEDFVRLKRELKEEIDGGVLEHTLRKQLSKDLKKKRLEKEGILRTANISEAILLFSKKNLEMGNLSTTNSLSEASKWIFEEYREVVGGLMEDFEAVEAFVSRKCLEKTVEWGEQVVKNLKREVEVTAIVNEEMRREREGRREEEEGRRRAVEEESDGKRRALEEECADLRKQKEVFDGKIIELNRKLDRYESLLQAKESSATENQDRLLKDLKNQIVAYEDKMRIFERDAVLKNAEFEKEKALLLGKINYLEKGHEEMSRKEKDSGNETRNLKKELTAQIREINMKAEQMQKTQTDKIEELKEKIAELEVNI